MNINSYKEFKSMSKKYKHCGKMSYPPTEICWLFFDLLVYYEVLLKHGSDWFVDLVFYFKNISLLSFNKL